MRDLLGLALFGFGVVVSFWFKRICSNKTNQPYVWVVLLLGILLYFGSFLACHGIDHFAHALHFGVP